MMLFGFLHDKCIYAHKHSWIQSERSQENLLKLCALLILYYILHLLIILIYQ
jgi:hypothetical protein